MQETTHDFVLACYEERVVIQLAISFVFYVGAVESLSEY